MLACPLVITSPAFNVLILSEFITDIMVFAFYFFSVVLCTRMLSRNLISLYLGVVMD